MLMNITSAGNEKILISLLKLEDSSAICDDLQVIITLKVIFVKLTVISKQCCSWNHFPAR